MPATRKKTALRHGKRAKKEEKARSSTKEATVLRQLGRPKGTSISELQKSIGWQPHSLRAALTGLRKKGHAIERFKDDHGATRYRLAKKGGAK